MLGSEILNLILQLWNPEFFQLGSDFGVADIVVRIELVEVFIQPDILEENSCLEFHLLLVSILLLFFRFIPILSLDLLLDLEVRECTLNEHFQDLHNCLRFPLPVSVEYFPK
jgi:hypothetical protein